MMQWMYVFIQIFNTTKKKISIMHCIYPNHSFWCTNQSVDNSESTFVLMAFDAPLSLVSKDLGATEKHLK